MSFSKRDKLLALLLPAILVLGVYELFFARSKIAECSQAAKTLEKTQATAPRPEEILAKERQLGKTTHEAGETQIKLEAAQQKWLCAVAFCATGSQRNERIEKLTSLLNKHDLRPMEDAEVDAGLKETKLSASTESLAKTIERLSPAQRPQLRRVRFHGRYADVLLALEELSQGETLALPVGLTMKTSDDPERRDWILFVWI
jgi:hypothetical protein